jgi:hypothetical protein
MYFVFNDGKVTVRTLDIPRGTYPIKQHGVEYYCQGIALAFPPFFLQLIHTHGTGRWTLEVDCRSGRPHEETSALDPLELDGLQQSNSELTALIFPEIQQDVMEAAKQKARRNENAMLVFMYAEIVNTVRANVAAACIVSLITTKESLALLDQGLVMIGSVKNASISIVTLTFLLTILNVQMAAQM